MDALSIRKSTDSSLTPESVTPRPALRRALITVQYVISVSH